MKNCSRTIAVLIVVCASIVGGSISNAHADIQTLTINFTVERFDAQDIFGQRVNNPNPPDGTVSGSFVVTWSDATIGDWGVEVLLVNPVDSIDLVIDGYAYETTDVSAQFVYVNGELLEVALDNIRDTHGTGVCPGADDVHVPFTLEVDNTIAGNGDDAKYASVNYPGEGTSAGDFYGWFGSDTVSGTWSLGTVATNVTSWGTVKAQYR